VTVFLELDRIYFGQIGQKLGQPRIVHTGPEKNWPKISEMRLHSETKKAKIRNRNGIKIINFRKKEHEKEHDEKRT